MDNLLFLDHLAQRAIGQLLLGFAADFEGLEAARRRGRS
jgi:hypothetical protein